MTLWILRSEFSLSVSSDSNGPLFQQKNKQTNKQKTVFAAGETLRANIITITWGVFVCVCVPFYI